MTDDPARRAAEAPEPPAAGTGRRSGADGAPTAADGTDADHATDPVLAVGVGPGAPTHRTHRCEAAVRAADVVVGFDTVVDLVTDLVDGDTDLLRCGYDDQPETLAAFADRVAAGERGVAVLMGDPNHSGYTLVGRVERAVDRPVRVVPGVSSLQVAASRARTPMEETTFATLHVRGDLDAPLARLRADVGDRHLLVLPHPSEAMPETVAAHLLESGADPDLTALVLERLTFDDERIVRTTLGDLAAGPIGADDGDVGGDRPEDVESAFSDLSVLVVRRS